MKSNKYFIWIIIISMVFIGLFLRVVILHSSFETKKSQEIENKCGNNRADNFIYREYSGKKLKILCEYIGFNSGAPESVLVEFIWPTVPLYRAGVLKGAKHDWNYGDLSSERAVRLELDFDGSFKFADEYHRLLKLKEQTAIKESITSYPDFVLYSDFGNFYHYYDLREPGLINVKKRPVAVCSYGVKQEVRQCTLIFEYEDGLAAYIKFNESLLENGKEVFVEFDKLIKSFEVR